MSAGIHLTALIIASALSGCKSKQEEAFERVAREMNPVFVALRPNVNKMFALPADRFEEIEKLCLGQDDLLITLELKKDVLEARELELRNLGVAWHAEQMRSPFNREPCDKKLPINQRRPERCAEWCLEQWRALAATVETLREAGKRVDVKIEPLLGSH